MARLSQRTPVSHDDYGYRSSSSGGGYYGAPSGGGSGSTVVGCLAIGIAAVALLVGGWRAVRYLTQPAPPAAPVSNVTPAE